MLMATSLPGTLCVGAGGARKASIAFCISAQLAKKKAKGPGTAMSGWCKRRPYASCLTAVFITDQIRPCQ